MYTVKVTAPDSETFSVLLREIRSIEREFAVNERELFCEFECETTNQRLILDFLWLMLSLGCRAIRTERTPARSSFS